MMKYSNDHMKYIKIKHNIKYEKTGRKRKEIFTIQYGCKIRKNQILLRKITSVEMDAPKHFHFKKWPDLFTPIEGFKFTSHVGKVDEDDCSLTR